MRRLLLLSYILVFSFVAAAAQQASVVSKIDSVSILIGQQAHLTVEVTARKGANVTFPHFKRAQQMVPGVEVVETSLENRSESDDQLTVSKTFTLTSFDGKLYAIPGMKVKVDGKVYTSNQLALKVLECEVDTLHPEKFFPPKDVQDNPFMWSEWSPLYWLGVLVMLVSAFLAYLILRLKQNKPIVVRVRVVKKIPAHQKALNEMTRLKSESFNTAEEQKQYYTHLTDTLRKYIRERFGFNAMEMTSSEIIEQLKTAGDNTMIDELRELFATADLVKFAKYSSLLGEKDMNLVNAIQYIDQTKHDEQPQEERIVPKLSDDDIKTRKNRITIKTLIWCCAILATVLVIYIAYHVYLLTL